MSVDSRLAGTIPLCRTHVTGRELDLMARCIVSGKTSGGGGFGRKCERLLQEALDVPHVLLTTSGSSALETASLLCELEPGDEVIVPALAAPSTANAFLNRGARLVFVDVRADSLTVDEKALDTMVSPRTRAIVAYHYAGIACRMDAILALAQRHDIQVIEDVSCAFGATYQGQSLGTFGDLGALSFHQDRPITCGEGGALITANDAYLDRAEVIREKGTNRSQFFRGQVDKYTWVDIGSSYVMSEVLAAFLSVQLDVRSELRCREHRLRALYHDMFSAQVSDGALTPLTVPRDSVQAGGGMIVLTRNKKERDGLIDHLKEAGIAAERPLPTLHDSPLAKSLGKEVATLPVAEDAVGRLIRLPFFLDMSETELERISGALRRYFNHPRTNTVTSFQTFRD